jgi:guanylate kinase
MSEEKAESEKRKAGDYFGFRNFSSQLLRSGILFVVCGPSGSGKTTLCRRLAAEDPQVWYSVSCTTRSPRAGEADGVDYWFLNRDDFELRSGRGEFLEHAKVHHCHWYGTLKGPVLERLRRGVDVVMDLDVQGAAQLRNAADVEIRKAMVDSFILPPSIEELIARVRLRGPMAREEEDRRMTNAREEIAHWPEFAYSLVSGDREDDFSRFRTIVDAERMRSARWCRGEM